MSRESPALLSSNASLPLTSPRSRKDFEIFDESVSISKSNAYGTDSPVAPPKFSSRTVGASSVNNSHSQIYFFRCFCNVNEHLAMNFASFQWSVPKTPAEVLSL